jgi:hypothetical protein
MKYQVHQNAIVYGHLKIDSPGEYVFKSNNYWGRHAFFVNGKLVFQVFRGSQKGRSDSGGVLRSKERITLPRGYVPFCLVGYVDARGSIGIPDWATPTQQSYRKIPQDVVFHDPQDYEVRDAAELWSRIHGP